MAEQYLTYDPSADPPLVVKPIEAVIMSSSDRLRVDRVISRYEDDSAPGVITRVERGEPRATILPGAPADKPGSLRVLVNKDSSGYTAALVIDGLKLRGALPSATAWSVLAYDPHIIVSGGDKNAIKAAIAAAVRAGLPDEMRPLGLGELVNLQIRISTAVGAGFRAAKAQ